MGISSYFELHKIDPTLMYKVAETDIVSEHPPSIQDTQPAIDSPSLFTFSTTQEGPVTTPVRLRESGIPEFVPLRLSFDPEPIWLGQPKGDFHDRTFEVKDGFRLTGIEEMCVMFCFIRF